MWVRGGGEREWKSGGRNMHVCKKDWMAYGESVRFFLYHFCWLVGLG